MKIGMFGLLSAGALASVANAGFVGWQSELLAPLGNGHVIMNVYAVFSNSTDRVLNVFNTNITTNHAGGFFQSAGNPFWAAGNTENKNTSDDSWVNIGTNPNGTGNAGGNGGTTVADPNFVNFTDANDSTDFSFIQGSGGGAGWYNGNPANTYGYAFEATGPNFRVLLAHFVITAPSVGNVVNWNASLTISIGGVTQEGVFGTGPNTFQWIVPGPGALALLGVAGLTSRRRRA